MKALSLSRPWPQIIMSCGKTIENRSRRDARMPYMCRHRGALLLHAAKSWDAHASEFVARNELASASQIKDLNLGDRKAHPAGAIVALCQVRGHVDPEGKVHLGPRFAAPSHTRVLDRVEALWWCGRWGLVLDRVEAVEPVVCSGSLGLWTPPDDVLKRFGVVPPDRRQTTLFQAKRERETHG